MRCAAACVLAALLLSACSRPPALSSPDAGRSTGAEDAEILFDVEAGFVGEGALEVAVGVPLSSLRYTLRGDSVGGSLRSTFALSVRVMRAGGGPTLRSWSVLDTVQVGAGTSTRRDSSVLHVDTFAVGSGRFDVVAEVEERSSRRRAERRLTVDVPSAEEAAVSIPKVERCVGGVCRRDVGLHVAAPLDSVRFTTHTTGTADASLALYRLRRDTTVALPPFWVGPPPGSLAARGLSLDTAEAEPVFVLPSRSEGEGARWVMGPLEPGVYAVYGRADEATSMRTLGVWPAGFPQPSTLAEAIDALAYIAYAEEQRDMRRAGDGAERRAAFDAFWARTASGRVEAERTLQRYYARVEEANRRFTTSKLGWKTDRGMIYVVFGPPSYVERTPAAEVWHYGAFGRPSETFVFERGVGYGTTGGPFEPYVLRRDAAYELAWRRAVRVWRSGSTGR